MLLRTLETALAQLANKEIQTRPYRVTRLLTCYRVARSQSVPDCSHVLGTFLGDLSVVRERSVCRRCCISRVDSVGGCVLAFTAAKFGMTPNIRFVCLPLRIILSVQSWGTGAGQRNGTAIRWWGGSSWASSRNFAAHDSVTDYSSFTWSAILAAQAMALNSDLELGSGIVGYGRHYWRTFTDGVSGTFFTEAIVPAITRGLRAGQN